MSAVVPVSPSRSPAVAAAEAYAAQSLAEETLRGYRADWAHFVGWCRQEGWQPLPAEPQAVAAYLSSLATTHGRSALRRRLTAIGHAHRLKEVDWVPSHPAIRHTLRGILRQHGIPARQSAALTTTEIKRLVATCDEGLTGKRDRALMLIGFAGALRRSEIVAIAREHLRFTDDGMTLHIPRSKSDPGGEGVDLGITRGSRPETCPVHAMEEWLRASRCNYGPVFRRVDAWGNIDLTALVSDAVRQIIRRRAAMAKLTVDLRERLSPHGLRAGFITQAYKAGVPDEVIMGHTRHKDHATMRRYIRRAKLVDESPVKKLGL